jgi:hypothetical protein
MSQLGTLLALIHDAYPRLTTFQAEYRDWARPLPSLELILEQSDRGKARPRWSGGGPFPTAAETTRRIWLGKPDRIRVEITHAQQLVTLGVMAGDHWWRWDRGAGATGGVASLDSGNSWTPPPALLTPPLLDPTLVLPAVRFEALESGDRCGRSVVRVRAVPRWPSPDVRSLHYEIDFDAEHGTILYRAALRGKHLVSLTEAITVAYGVPLQSERFIFASPDA